MLAVPVGPRLSVVAATNCFAQRLQPHPKFLGSSARFPLRSWLRAGSAVSGDLSQRRSARHARRDRGTLSLQARCLPVCRGEDFRLAQSIAASLRRFTDPCFASTHQRNSPPISKRVSFLAGCSVDSPGQPRSSCPRVVRPVADPCIKNYG
jgi:hypothetical protein